MTKDEALRLALEALESTGENNGYHGVTQYFDETMVDQAITAIKAALEANDEPVAWRTFDGEGGYDYRTYENNEDYANDWDKRNPKHKGWVEPLYKTPPQRTWVGLTDKDWNRSKHTEDFEKGVDWAEEMLRGKTHDAIVRHGRNPFCA